MNNSRLWLTSLCAVVALLLHTGCTDECVDRFDCRDKGENFICVDSKCVAGPAGGDAGEEDAGVDAGEDAGQTDAGADAGVVDAGPECTAGNPNCGGPFRCELPGDGDAGTCTPLYIALTTQLDAGVGGAIQQALLIQFNSTTNNVTLGTSGSNSRFPRFSGAGDAVAFVQAPTTPGTIELRQHDLATDTETVLTDSDDAGTEDFVQLEYAPASKVLWTKLGMMNTRDGIQLVPGDGGAVSTALAQGGYGDWFPNGSDFAFGGNDLGVHSLGDGGTRILQTVDAVEPRVSPDGKWIAYLVEDTSVTDVFATSLSIVSTATGGTPNPVETSKAPAGTVDDGGTTGTYAIDPAWAGNTRIVYVRVTWFRDDAGTPNICTPTDPICGGTEGQQIVFRNLDSTGKPTGTEVVHAAGVQPAVSPDGSWLAYVTGDGAGQSILHVVPINASGAATDAGFQHPLPQIVTGGKDAHPRWQPK